MKCHGKHSRENQSEEKIKNNQTSTSESIKTDIKSLETNIRDSLMELQDSLLSKNT